MGVDEGNLLVMGVDRYILTSSSHGVVVVCCFLTLTDPLRIHPWSQDR